MAYGLRVTGSHGIVQIDENWRNYSLVAKGTGTLNNASPVLVLTGASGKFAQVSNAAITANSIIALSSASTPCVMLKQEAGSFVAYGAADGTFDWWVFDRVASPGASTYGLRIRKPSGDIIFDSDYPPMRVVANIPLNASFGVNILGADADGTTYPSVTSGFDVPTGRDWAWATNIRNEARWAGSGGGMGATPNNCLVGLMRGGQSGGGLIYSVLKYMIYPGSQNQVGYRYGNMLMVDVTDL